MTTSVEPLIPNTPPALAAPRSGRYSNPGRAEAARVYDIRIATDLPEHRKVTKLRALLENAHPQINLGDKGFRCLIQLWTRAGKHHRSGVVRLSVEDLEFEAGWREGMCPPTHYGLLVRTLIQAGFLVELEADSAYELHDWAEHQPWVTEGLRASVAGRFHKLVALAKSRQGLTHEDALRYAHQRVPEYAQLTKTTLEDQLDSIADDPEQLEMQEVGVSRAAIMGEKAKPRSRNPSGAKVRTSVESMLTKVTPPQNVDATMFKRFLEHRAALRTLKLHECESLASHLDTAAEEGVDLGKLLLLMSASGYTDVPLTVRFNRERLSVPRTELDPAPNTGVSHASKGRHAQTLANCAEDERSRNLFLEVTGLDLRNADAESVARFFSGDWKPQSGPQPTESNRSADTPPSEDSPPGAS
ncbi:hypothetical protein [Dolichospermum phage Dfl-JY45]